MAVAWQVRGRLHYLAREIAFSTNQRRKQFLARGLRARG